MLSIELLADSVQGGANITACNANYVDRFIMTIPNTLPGPTTVWRNEADNRCGIYATMTECGDHTPECVRGVLDVTDDILSRIGLKAGAGA